MSRQLNLNMQSLTLEEFEAKRHKVVRDMVAAVSADFERGLPAAWQSHDQDSVRRAQKCLDVLLESVHCIGVPCE